MTGPYDDILSADPPVSRKHPRMPALERAAQFSPFAALSGYGEAAAEMARVTEEKRVLDESGLEEINRALCFLRERIETRPRAELCYFVPDEKKDGGKTVTGLYTICRIDEMNRVLGTAEAGQIPFEDLYRVTPEEEMPE